MAESKVEEVARAIFKSDWPKDDWDRLGKGGHHQARYSTMARAAIEAMRPTNKQVLAAVDEWLSEPEGFSLRCERLPDTVELEWLRSAALIGAGAVSPAALNEEVAG
jgi:hypothetical protein